MKTLFLLPLFLTIGAIGQTAEPPDSPMDILEFKWERVRQAAVKQTVPEIGPARAMILENKNFQRNARQNAPVGAIDPNDLTVDGRSAAIERNVQESRRPQTDPTDGFSYRVTMRNTTRSVVEIVFWEYQFTELANPANVVRRQFLCAVKMKPKEKKDMLAFSASGPSDIISVESLGRSTGKLFDEKVVINRLELADGNILQRKDWNFAEVKAAIKRAVETPWGKEMCRPL